MPGVKSLLLLARPPTSLFASRIRIDEILEESNVSAALRPAHPAPIMTASYDSNGAVSVGDVDGVLLLFLFQLEKDAVKVA